MALELCIPWTNCLMACLAWALVIINVAAVTVSLALRTKQLFVDYDID